MDYKFYIPASTKYVLFEKIPLKEDSITLIQIFEENGEQISISYQNGDPTMEVHEYISYGQILEVYRQVKAGAREYDPYAIFPESMRPK